ncbi:MAG: hypothetical protein A2Z06_03850 [Candidatus Glassbacteria bacterium RBG_16_58_8]|uniref:PDZ domain-containing protein n=1 Tax=Candidatus Glassbacteria bacterium RBG_16_58_8 TaxID=1817866 RepID=A0A1F5YDI1_9BACT|nr:MAG: hypothetical protein A2Z06_03850 [Candidatus Glassbacteria bacterium RBG_16_58_8]
MNRSVLFLALFAGLVILAWSGYFARSADDDDLLEVDVRGVAIDPSTNSPVVILVGKEHRKAVPIFIGAGEAGAIARELEDVETVRPMTHDLMMNIIEGVDARVERAIITDLKENIFFAQIILKVGRSKKTIDSRPSDAIALALRAGAPIFVSADVMEASSSGDLTGWMVEESLSKRFGFQVQNISGELIEAMELEDEEGVLVSDVRDGGPADREGLHRGDVILRLQGSRVADVEDFNHLLIDLPEGEDIRIVVAGPGGERDVSLSPQDEEE